MKNSIYITNPVVRLTLVDQETWDFKDIVFLLFDTPIARKWLDYFKKRKKGAHDFRENSFKVADKNKLKDKRELAKFNETIEIINRFYDRPIEYINGLDDRSLNYLHEQYEVYGERLDELLKQDYWKKTHQLNLSEKEKNKWPGERFNEEMHFAFIKLNELIHNLELIMESWSGTKNPGGVITTSLNPREDFDLTEDDWLSIVKFPKFGDLCLGYNTLGKNLEHIVYDQDHEAVDRNAVYLQETWSDELYVYLNYSSNYPKLREYKELWDNLEITKKLGYEFGNHVQNREGYIKIGEIHPDVYENFYSSKDGILIDFTKYNTLYNVEIVPDGQINPTERLPQWKKPQKRLGKRIDRIDNNENHIITWILNDICTYNCRYCPPELHNGKNHKYSWEHVEPFINKIFEFYNDKPVMFSLSGGEPTLSPFFPQLVHKIYEKGGYVGITTNLARSNRYIEQNFKYLMYACCSFHPAMEFPAGTADDFIEKLQSVGKVTYPSVRVMMDPLHWDDTVDWIEKVKEKTEAKIELVQIDEQYGSQPKKLAEIPYTEDQLSYINNFEPYDNEWNKKKVIDELNPLYRRPKGEKIISFEDGSTEILRSIAPYINAGQTNFFNYMCKIGSESLFIHQSGKIKRGNCSVGGVIGNIDNWQNIDWKDLKRPVKCDIAKCHCGADVQITKWKM